MVNWGTVLLSGVYQGVVSFPSQVPKEKNMWLGNGTRKGSVYVDHEKWQF